MKRVLTVLMALIIAIVLSGCQEEPTYTAAEVDALLEEAKAEILAESAANDLYTTTMAKPSSCRIC